MRQMEDVLQYSTTEGEKAKLSLFFKARATLALDIIGSVL